MVEERASKRIAPNPFPLRVTIGTGPFQGPLSYPVAMGATPDNLEPFDIHCGTCGGAISVQLRPSDADAAPEPTRYTCPWCATEESRYQLPGDVLWVARGHHEKDVKPQ